MIGSGGARIRSERVGRGRIRSGRVGRGKIRSERGRMIRQRIIYFFILFFHKMILHISFSIFVMNRNP